MVEIPVAKVVLSDDEIKAAEEVLRSGMLRQGRKVEEFERMFAEKVGARFAIAVSSGTAALHIAYLATLEKGAEVLVPAFTHISTASMVCFTGCKPIFCDIDPRTFTIDVEDAKEKITSNTSAIVPVHLFGNACDIDELVEIAEDHKLKIIWDAAQAHGTEYKGRDVGSFDDIVCYSFYPTKNITTCEGGMITTNDAELNRKCRLLREHGQERKYYHTMLGLNYRMTDVEAAIGIEQLKKLDMFIERRIRNAEFLTKHLSKIDGIETPYVKQGVKHTYNQYSILVDPEKLGMSRDELATALREKGIGTAIHYPIPLHLQPVFKEMLGTKEGDLPVSEEISRRILSLPVHPHLDIENLNKISEIFSNIFL
jgi:perosamine synthetase